MVNDVVIVGAGLIGCGIAYELAKRGASVTIYDRAEPARAASWAGAGMLAPYSEEVVDPALLALCTASLHAYPAFVDGLARTYRPRCRAASEGTLHVAFDDASAAERAAQCDAFRRNGAVASVLDRDATLAREPMLGGNVRGAVYVANEAHVDNRRLGRALVAACTDAGVRFERTSGVALEADARRVRGIRTEHGFAAAGDGRQRGRRVGRSGSRAFRASARIAVRPVAGEMLALAVPKGFTRGLVWSQHVYLVPRDDGRLADRRDRRRTRLRRARHRARRASVARRGAAHRARRSAPSHWWRRGPACGRHRTTGGPISGATSIGGYFVAAGHYRNGILLTPVTAQAIAALISGERPAVEFGAFRSAARRTGSGLKRSKTPSAMRLMVNGTERDVAAGVTVETLLQTLALRRDGVAVALNDDVVPRAEHATRTLNDGDRLEIIVAVAGG